MSTTFAVADGFARPVFEAQAAFRRVMDAMARPGRRVRLDGPDTAPGLFGPAQTALALTLADASAPLWSAAASDELRAWLAFHTGARLADAPAEAAFAFLGRGDVLPEGLPLGSDDYPDRSATVVIEVEVFGSGAGLTLSGPGIAGTADLAVKGLPAGFAARLAGNRALFPRGLDFLLTAGRDLVALPRSTRCRPAED